MDPIIKAFSKVREPGTSATAWGLKLMEFLPQTQSKEVAVLQYDGSVCTISRTVLYSFQISHTISIKLGKWREESV